MRKIYRIAACALLLAAATGCNYDLVPSTELPIESAIRNESDLQKAVYGVYESLTRDKGGYASDYTLYADCTGGDVAPAANNGQITPYITFSVTQTDPLIAELYLAMNRPIAYANIAMAQAAKLEESYTAELAALTGDEAKKAKQGQIDNVKRMAAELKTLRAIMHLDVARVYAQLPTVAGVDMNADDSGVVIIDRVYPVGQRFERSTLAQTYAFITTELKEAMAALDTEAGKKRRDGGLNYWAAQAALSRACLYMGDWAGAYAAAVDVIGSGVYTLYTHDNYLTTWKQNGGTEVIAEFTTSDNTKNNPQRNSLGYYTNPNGYAEVAASDAFVAVLAAMSGDDIRKGSVTERVSSTGRNRAFYTIKYAGKTGSASPLYNNNPRLLRLAEMYLVASEAALKAGRQADADKYYNDLRRSRYAAGTYTDLSGVTIDDILADRRVELFCEGHRMLDLKRNNRVVPDGLDATKTRPASDNILLLPYPMKELDISPDLVQNPR